MCRGLTVSDSVTLQVSKKGRLIYARGLKVGKEGSGGRDWPVCDIHEVLYDMYHCTCVLASNEYCV
jgi:hypothetical protein